MKHFLTRLIGTLSVFIFGLLATLLLTEISLAVFAKSRQVVKNLNNQSDPNDEFVILALGESTTVSVLNVQGDDYSWPATLEELLNEESTLDTQFKVINEGWNGIDSDFILNNLEQNLDQYQPDLVISMMGINDHGVVEYDAVAGIEEHGFLQKFRTFRLVKYLSSNLREKLQESQIDQNLTDCDSEAECIKVARVYFKEDKLTWAVKFWQKALKYNPTNQISLLRLADYYLDQRRFDQASHYISLLEQHHDQNLEVLVSLGEFYQIQNDQARARNYFKRALEKDPQYIPAQVGLICSISRAPDFADQYEKITSELKNNPTKAVEPYVALAETVQYLDRKEEALIWLMQALNLDPQNIEALSSMARFQVKIGNLEQAEVYYQKILSQDPSNLNALIELSKIYAQTDRPEQKKAELKKALSSNNKYVSNYLRLYDQLNSREIPLIAVQYPLRSLDTLSLIFKNKSGVWLVENKDNFLSVVEQNGYENVFLDRFAGDFGHASKKGNQLLAEQIKSTIVNNWNQLINF